MPLTIPTLMSFLIPKSVIEIITGELLGDGHISYNPLKPSINGRLDRGAPIGLSVRCTLVLWAPSP